jgi:hypothetical protein
MWVAHDFAILNLHSLATWFCFQKSFRHKFLNKKRYRKQNKSIPSWTLYILKIPRGSTSFKQEKRLEWLLPRKKILQTLFRRNQGKSCCSIQFLLSHSLDVWLILNHEQYGITKKTSWTWEVGFLFTPSNFGKPSSFPLPQLTKSSAAFIRACFIRMLSFLKDNNYTNEV